MLRFVKVLKQVNNKKDPGCTDWSTEKLLLKKAGQRGLLIVGLWGETPIHGLRMWKWVCCGPGTLSLHPRSAFCKERMCLARVCSFRPAVGAETREGLGP